MSALGFYKDVAKNQFVILKDDQLKIGRASCRERV